MGKDRIKDLIDSAYRKLSLPEYRRSTLETQMNQGEFFDMIRHVSDSLNFQNGTEWNNTGRKVIEYSSDDLIEEIEDLESNSNPNWKILMYMDGDGAVLEAGSNDYIDTELALEPGEMVYNGQEPDSRISDSYKVNVRADDIEWSEAADYFEN